MSSGMVVPSEYKYVVASLLPNAWLLLGQSIMVGRYRKKAGIPYPQLYAEKAEAQVSRDAHLFNCAQRAHQNTLEAMPFALIIILVSGITLPRFAAVLSLLWVTSRVMFSVGYLTGEPKNRSGILHSLSSIGLIGTLFVCSYLAITSWVLA